MITPYDLSRHSRLKGFNYAARRTYFITLCVAERIQIFTSRRVCDIARNIIFHYRDVGWYWLTCYCLMPDHVHLLIRLKSEDHTVSSIVAKLKRRIREQNSVVRPGWRWQSGFHDHVVREYEDAEELAKYIMLNPVRAGLVDDVAEYPYSGIVDIWR